MILPKNLCLWKAGVIEYFWEILLILISNNAPANIYVPCRK